MKTLLRVSFITLVLSALCATEARAQIPAENRGMESISFSPGTAVGVYDIHARWFVETEPSTGFKDLSADVDYSVNSLLVTTVGTSATITAASPACFGTTPPCSNGACGHVEHRHLDGERHLRAFVARRLDRARLLHLCVRRRDDRGGCSDDDR